MEPAWLNILTKAVAVTYTLSIKMNTEISISELLEAIDFAVRKDNSEFLDELQIVITYLRKEKADANHK